MQGEILYPGNQLKDAYPEQYERSVARYQGREMVREQPVPMLGCLWNDVLYFSPVHPEQVRDALAELGKEFSVTPWEYFVVDPELISSKDAVIYMFKYLDRKDKYKSDNWEPYDPKRVEELTSLPDETKAYFKRALGEGINPLLWIQVPHIMYRGTLDTSGLERIRIS